MLFLCVSDDRVVTLACPSRSPVPSPSRLTPRNTPHFASTEGVRITFECQHTGEMRRDLLLQSVDGCDCPRYRKDPDGCTDCLFAYLGVPDESMAA